MNQGLDGTRTSERWWLRSTLARLAFGASTRDVRTPSPTLRQLLAPATIAKPDLDDPAQREFGGYELLELIGQGGMGLVYRAHQRALNRDVAIKLLSAGRWASEEFIAGFRNEAQNAALLQHPNIVVVHEMGEHAGLVFYAMQLVRGCSLSQQLAAQGPMPQRAAARLLRTVAEAVDYAHRLGVLHLDLKPGNILLDAHGTPLIADFGLARRLEQTLDEGHVSGTPSYMAPEQAQPGATPLTPAADTWALGAVLYELLTGQPPFEGVDHTHTLRLLQAGSVRRPSRLAPVAADLEAICLHCLHKDPAQRYPSARVLADDLGRFLEGRAVSVRPLNLPQRGMRWARREPRVAGIALLAVIALLVGMLATTLQWRRAEAAAAATGASLRAQRALAMQQAHASARDFSALPGLAANLATAQRDGDDEGVRRERTRLGVIGAAFPQLIDRIRVPPDSYCLALSPDGTRLAVCTTHNSQILMFDTASGRQLWHTSLQPEPGFWGHAGEPKELWRLHFTADGRDLIAADNWPFQVISPSGMDHWRLDARTGAIARPQTQFPDLVDATYSEDGRFALLRRWSTTQVQLWDARAWKPISRMARYTADNPGWLIAPDAKFIVRWSKRVDILAADTLAVRHTILPEDPGQWFSAWDVSPDARWLALGDRQGQVLLVDPASGARRRLLPGPNGWVHRVRFSADGAWLAAGSEDGSLWLWQRADGFRHGRSIAAGIPVWDLSADPMSGVVRAGSMGSAGLWQLSGLDASDRPAQLLSPLLGHAQQITPYAIDVHPASGLLATASQDGEIRLWRIPPSAVRKASAPPLAATQSGFDGRHLVAVDGRRVRVLRAEDERPQSPALVHPQAVAFAVLNTQGDVLLTTSGRELRVWDWRRGRLRFPPLTLPNTPLHLAIDARGQRAYVGYTLARGRPLTEAVATLSLQDGHALAAPAEIPDGLESLAPSADGRRVMLVSQHAVELRDAASLRPLGKPLRIEDASVMAAAQNHDGTQVAIAVGETDDPGVRIWSVAGRRWLPFVSTSQTPISVAYAPRGELVATLPCNCALEIIDRGARRRIELPAGTTATRTIAFSPDGRILAQALADGVLLLDLRTGEWLGAPLRTSIDSADAMTRLAFDPSGRRLLGRTYYGRWLWWRIEPDMRPQQASAEDARLLAPPRSLAPASLTPPSAHERRLLRTRDRGPSPLGMPRATAGCTDPTPVVPPRDPSTPPQLLSLDGSVGAIDPRAHDPDFNTKLVIANLCGLPTGVVRLDGVDFDVRGALQNKPKASPSLTQTTVFARGIVVPPDVARIAAVELLATSPTIVRDPPPETRPVQAYVRLNYADGGSVRLPVRFNQDVTRVDWDLPPQSRVAWRLWPQQAEFTDDPRPWWNLFRVRLRNPHPQRAVHDIDLLGARVTWNGFTVFAMTVDPLPTSPRQVAVSP